VGCVPKAQAPSEAVLALAAQHGFAHWVYSCGVLHGWRLVLQGQTEDGLGQIRQDQGTKARQLLAPLYGWFTEGFDTPDLQEARAVLRDVA
jgi:predicted ATPase